MTGAVMAAWGLVVGLLWLPGALLRRGLGLAPGPWGTGAAAVDAALSLAFLSAVLLPAYLAGAPVRVAAHAVLLALAALAAACAVRARRASAPTPTPTPPPTSTSTSTSRDRPGGDRRDFDIASDSDSDDRFHGATAAERAAFAVAVALLVPVTLAHAGANVDDWWDLSFVSGWLAEGRFSFAQMALSPPPGGEAAVHPRFLWSAWLAMQAVVASLCGEPAWQTQAGPLAAWTMVLVVSAQAALARVLLRGDRALVAATVAATPAWVWGTEALPLFVRGYQDKLFAAFVLAPVLLALLLRTVLSGAAPSPAAPATAEAGSGATRVAERRRRAARRDAWSLAAAATATVSVHGLVYTMAVMVGAFAVAAIVGRGLAGWARRHAGVVLALAVPLLWPLAQGTVLAATFGQQGIDLQLQDNPVVRAHLSLNRIVGAGSPWWIVHPGAVFGSVALVAFAGLVRAWRGRPARGDAARVAGAARALAALTLLPCALLFVPGVAGLAGRALVPWMLYRVGWLVPVAPLLAMAALGWGRARRGDGAAASRAPARHVAAARAGAVLVALVVAALAGTTAADRLRRGLDEHPGQPDGRPRASAAIVDRFLAAQPGRDAVMAPPNFAELVPALTGKPVVAFPERGSVVFSHGAVEAYSRLRDRAAFFASSTSSSRRDEIAARYGVRWAVLPRRLVAHGSEEAWMRRFGPEALLAALAADASPAPACERGACRTWWSATRDNVAEGLGASWSVALETPDYFVVERAARAKDAAASPWEPGREGATTNGGEAWLQPFAGVLAGTAQPTAAGRDDGLADDARDAARHGEHGDRDASQRHAAQDVLAAAVSRPGALVEYASPPRFLQPTVLPVWTEGPMAWEDAPAEATITLDAGVDCVVDAVDVVPHLPRDRREVLEIRIDDQVLRARAQHERPLRVALARREPRRRVTVHVASLLGNPVSLADLRLVGDSRTCGATPVRVAPRVPALEAGAGELLQLAAAMPSSGRPFVALARQASAQRRAADAPALLRAATVREPSLVEAWVELGFAEDALAVDPRSTDTAKDTAKGVFAVDETKTPGSKGSDGSPADAAQAHRVRARAAFDGAVRADSRSAWAHGCRAWSRRGSGRPVAAVASALQAMSLDPLYADAWTILGASLGDLGADALALRALDGAERRDRSRNWPVLVRADLLAKRGDADAAAAVLRDWIARHPHDADAQAKLAAVVR